MIRDTGDGDPPQPQKRDTAGNFLTSNDLLAAAAQREDGRIDWALVALREWAVSFDQPLAGHVEAALDNLEAIRRQQIEAGS